jgi:undecaprenyl diphosphate synthase
VIGERSVLAKDLQESIEVLERATASNTGIGFQIAINYGGRDEIVRAVRRAAEKGLLNDPGRIDESLLNDCLDTAGIPDPDLLIRTCGEQRISNFLLWQLAYTEFYVTDLYWPDFSRWEFLRAIRSFQSRDRRFGGVEAK